MHRCLRGLCVATCIVACAYASNAGAADDGLRQEFEKYHYGRGVPENHGRAKQYLDEAAQSGEDWAILLIAQEQEKSNPQKALDAYLQLARNDNCIAQARLADAYSSGTLVKKNLTQAYFWLLLAQVNEENRRSNVTYSRGQGIGYIPGYPKSCLEAFYFSMGLLETKIKTHKMLSAKLIQVAEHAATNWTKGTVEKLLPDTAIIAAASDAGPKMQSRVATNTTPLSPALTANQKSSSPAEVLLKEDGAIFVVPVEINGAIRLNFAVDSGASNVTIPADVFSTLERTGTIQAQDIIGEQTVVLADGSQSKLPTFTIRSLKVGDKVIENVRATVAPSQGQLLLGQSFLGRFKSWSLDNAKHVLLLNPQ
jgi:clan AA aspartic protease (TIGR02281 family)